MWSLLFKPPAEAWQQSRWAVLKSPAVGREQCGEQLLQALFQPWGCRWMLPGAFAAKCCCCLCDCDLISPRHSAQHSLIVLTRSLLFSVCLEPSLGSRWLGWALQDEDGRSRTRVISHLPAGICDVPWRKIEGRSTKPPPAWLCLSPRLPANCRHGRTADEFTTATLPGFLH